MKTFILSITLLMSAFSFAQETTPNRCITVPTLTCGPGHQISRDQNGCYTCKPRVIPRPHRPVLSAKCQAAKAVIKNLAKMYITEQLHCNVDTDCSLVNYTGGPICGSRIVNAQGAAGLELMLDNPEYLRMSRIVQDSGFGSCGPIPLCMPRPPGKLKCINYQCQFERIPRREF